MITIVFLVLQPEGLAEDWLKMLPSVQKIVTQNSTTFVFDTK
jgi:hypothetical protein